MQRSGISEDQEEKLHEDVETVTDISYLGNGINSGCGCEAAVISRTRLGWVKSEFAMIHLAKKFSFKSNEVHTKAV